MSAINGSGTIGGAIFLWSWVNYRVLIGGKVRKKCATSTHQNNANIQNQFTEFQNDEPIITETATSELKPEFAEENDDTIPQISFCHKCGTKVIAGSLFCHKCGAKIY